MSGNTKPWLRFWCLSGVLLVAAGCASSPERKVNGGSQKAESREDIERSLQSVTGALSGQNVSQEELRTLSRDIQKDPSTRRAVEAVTGAVSGQSTAVKYCPVDGKRFSPTLKFCPEHDVELKNVE
jgi:hypothetical protein